jgi:hypothetical protein
MRRPAEAGRACSTSARRLAGELSGRRRGGDSLPAPRRPGGANTASRRLPCGGGRPWRNAEPDARTSTTAVQPGYGHDRDLERAYGRDRALSNTRITTINVTSPGGDQRRERLARPQLRGGLEHTQKSDGPPSTACSPGVTTAPSPRVRPSAQFRRLRSWCRPSQTVTELLPATFRVAVGGFQVPQLQWYRSGVAIPNATSRTYTLTLPFPPDSGAQFNVTAMNGKRGHCRSRPRAFPPFHGDARHPAIRHSRAIRPHAQFAHHRRWRAGGVQRGVSPVPRQSGELRAHWQVGWWDSCPHARWLGSFREPGFGGLTHRGASYTITSMASGPCGRGRLHRAEQPDQLRGQAFVLRPR